MLRDIDIPAGTHAKSKSKVVYLWDSCNPVSFTDGDIGVATDSRPNVQCVVIVTFKACISARDICIKRGLNLRTSASERRNSQTPYWRLIRGPWTLLRPLDANTGHHNSGINASVVTCHMKMNYQHVLRVAALDIDRSVRCLYQWRLTGGMNTGIDVDQF